MVIIMIKVAFCDDDLSVLNNIMVLLDQYRTEHKREMECAVFRSPLELLVEMEKGMRWDVLFLDVLMPGEDGIHVAKEIRQYDNVVKIIFLTSSPDFAVESYAVGAYFYQMKPVCAEDFFRLMDSLVRECEKAQQYSLVLCCKSGIARIDLNRLEYCEVIGRTLWFYLDDGNVMESTGSLDELCGKLARYENFLRPHRSFLVNMEHIKNISYKTITMDNLAEIPVPHGKCSQIKKRYLEYALNRNLVLLA